MLPCPQCKHLNRSSARYCGRCGTLLAVLPGSRVSLLRPLAPGDHLGSARRYRVDREIGRGGFGSTFLATDIVLDRQCVIKQLHFDPHWSDVQRQQMVTSFSRETQVLVQLNTPGHPNIPEIYDVFPEQLCLVMKYVTGESLHRVLKRRTDPLPEELAVRYVRDVCGALAYMHGQVTRPVLHRDLKPDNILVDERGRIWLIDFGLAWQEAHPTSGSAMPLLVAGTIGYTPTEQWSGAIDPRSDVYALMATLYELVSGQSPPVQPPAEGLDLSSLAPGVHPTVAALVRRATARSLELRPSAAILFDALSDALDLLTVPPPPAPEEPPKASRAVERDELNQMLLARLTTEGTLLLTGMPGVGKTALAASLAQKLKGSRPCFWQTAQAGAGVETVVWRLAAFLAREGFPMVWRQLQQARRDKASLQPIATIIDGLAAMLAECKPLVCLDDVHVLDQNEQSHLLLARLVELADRGSLLLLTTSRGQPSFGSYRATVPIQGLSEAETAALAAQAEVGLAAAQLRRLHTVTEGNPQLVTLALDSLRNVASPEALLASLTTSHDVESYLLREVDNRLDERQRAIMEAVAVLLGHSGTRDALEAILTTQGLQRVLSELRQRNLLVMSDGGAQPQYRQHVTLQEFYYNLLGRGQRLELHRRAAQYYEHSERELLIAARHYERAAQPSRVVDLLSGSLWDLFAQGHGREMLTLLLHAAAAGLDEERWVEATIAAGELATLLREPETGRTCFEQAYSTLSSNADRPGAALALMRLCRGFGELLEHDSPDEAVEWLERGLTYGGDGSEEQQARLLHRLGSVLTGTGAFEQASDKLNQALRFAGKSPRLQADVHSGLGVISCMKGDLSAGEEAFQSAVELYRQLGLERQVAMVESNLAQIREIQGDWESAALQYTRVLALAEKLGSVVNQLTSMLQLGLLALRRGDDPQAARWLEKVVSLARQHHVQEYQVNGLASTADLLLRRGDLTGAEAVLNEADAIAQEIRARFQQPEILWLRSQIALGRNNLAGAVTLAEQAVSTASELEMSLEEGIALRVLGEALIAQGLLEGGLEKLRESEAHLVEDPYEQARAQIGLGAALLRIYDPQGPALIESARQTFSRLGALRDLKAAERILAAPAQP